VYATKEDAMKIPHLLFLSCVAALVALAPGRAAELHGKARPLAHEKNCSAYGAGFRRVPRSDLCVKIGGWARAQASGGNSINWSALNTNAARTVAPQARGYLTTDVRQETGYGTLRAYFSAGVNHE
jgi:hypothetical protein